MIERGDGWEMHLGDCLEILPTLGPVDHVITDPPYGVGFKYASHVDTAEALPALIEGLMATVQRAASCSVVMCGNANVYKYPIPAWICAWVKRAAGGRNGLGGFNEFEPMLVYGKPSRRVTSDVFEVNGRIGKMYTDNWMPSGAEVHPCPKPEVLLLMLVEAFTEPGETILDPFTGSGTTGVAALRLGRRFVGVEKDETYFPVACERLRAETAGSTLQASRRGQLGLLGGVK